MKESTKGALLSALVYPGTGQLVLGLKISGLWSLVTGCWSLVDSHRLLDTGLKTLLTVSLLPLTCCTLMEIRYQ